MHASFIITAFALATLAVAAPPRRPPFYFPRPIRSPPNDTVNTTVPGEPAGPTVPACDLSAVQQPASTLPAPSGNLVLIALGQGTQNYTCASATATPSSIGAVAQLFNASCALSSNPTVGTAALGSIQETASIGAHFFVDNTTPDFDIFSLGNTVAKKVDDVPAPDAVKDVKWLRLQAQNVAGTTSGVKEVYRLNTVGGQPPATCAGTTAGQVLTVDYEAQYWVYA
jgi:hypothetical protein